MIIIIITQHSNIAIQLQFQRIKMKLNNYKMYRSSGFPMTKKKNPQVGFNYTTYGLLPFEQPYQYEVFGDGNNLLAFNEHEYVERTFSNLFHPQQQQNVHEKVKLNLQSNHNNLIILPILETDQAQRLIFPRRQEQQLKPKEEGQSEQKQQKESLLKEMVESIIAKKQNHTVVTLSILGIKSNGNLIDELNFEWLEEQQYKSRSVSELSLNLNNREQIKISKSHKNDIKIFQLNRQQISSWKEAKEIFEHYFQVHDYLNAWSQEKGKRLSGEIYQISQVQIDHDDGSIVETIKKTILLKFNQYSKNSNLMLTKIGQALSDRVNNRQPISKRDNPLMLFLSECFMRQSYYHYQVFSQLGYSQTIKEEIMNLTFNLQLPNKYTHLKNYCDKQKIIEKVKKFSWKQSKTTHLSGKKTKPQYIEAEKVTSKSFFYETESSKKKKNERRKEDQRILNQDESDNKIQEVYGTNRKK